ncbi:response regulator transcription factor [Sinomicrobium soli]|uniref:response regulator transcription factor n=1 Tax=Sinomicrobium sp. N-1-3-6 TaxID=2219864 RepID=UPI000DCF1952|nr:response regulator [Sinomicrobium sp. N-1-3-6]RAV29214.1 DNA-binding response regulator [Sinomicrobium sp. N-1-3-6]
MKDLKTHLSILLIDDHPIVLKAYRDALDYTTRQKGWTFDITEARNSNEALRHLERISPVYQIDLVFLDIQLPPSDNGTVISGDDLGLKIRQRSPQTRIAVLTTYNDPYRIHCILQNLQPEGFIVKNDLEGDEMFFIIRNIMCNPPYHSATVSQALRSVISGPVLDKVDRRLLYELSQGATLEQVEKVVPLGRSGIIKRKNKLKFKFGIPDGDDKALLKVAREKGFI